MVPKLEAKTFRITTRLSTLKIFTSASEAYFIKKSSDLPQKFW